MDPLLLILLAVTVFVVVMGALGLKTVKQARVVIIERLGKFHRVLQPGINIIWPILDKRRAIQWRVVSESYEGEPVVAYLPRGYIDLREQLLDFPRQHVITKDNVLIGVNGLLYYQITDPKRAVYEVANLPNALEKLAQTTLRNIIGDLDLDATLTSRDQINGKMRSVLDEASDKWGVKVNRVELQDITPPESVKVAMEKQMTAERGRRARILEAEGVKQAHILEAEGLRDAAVAEAEGDKRAQVLRAEGEAEARRRVAEGEAQALQAVGAALAGGRMDPAEYRIAAHYLGTLAEIGAQRQGDKTVFLPFEASAALAGLGGIKELFRAGPGCAPLEPVA
ncbi:MAG: paraslipin [Planctomycetes bacterium]|nr:paraslipin [Planctomycetota bacterium]